MAEQDTSRDEDGEISVGPVPVKTPSAWLPLLAAIIIMPAISYAMTQFVLLPKMKESLIKTATQGVALPGKEGTAPSAASPDNKKDGKPTTFEYAFDNIVVNLSGTKGTRYLKTSFTAFSSNPELRTIITRHRSELLNLTLNILSAKTLVDLETPGAKNMLLNELMENYNHALNSTIVDQIFFSEFVIQ